MSNLMVVLLVVSYTKSLSAFQLKSQPLCCGTRSSSAIFYVDESQNSQPEENSEKYLSQYKLNLDDKVTKISEPFVDFDLSSHPKQHLSSEERAENLQIIRKYRQDLNVLLKLGDTEGWLYASEDKKERMNKDPWYDLNNQLGKAYKSGNVSDIAHLTKMIESIGGPPEGIKMREYHNFATDDEIYDIGMSLETAERIIKKEEEKLKHEARISRWADEKKKKLKEEEEKLFKFCKEHEIDPYDHEALYERRWALISGKNKPKTMESLKDEYLAKVKREEKKVKAERIEGDDDIELATLVNDDESSLTMSRAATKNIEVKVSTEYDPSKSSPEQRKYYFKYNVCITNESSTDTIQLTGRSFLIQTVGSMYKDLVEGDGVMGKKPILKPGEVFQYTGTAPLNVRPLGTTPVAARMSGSYLYKIINTSKGESKSEENTSLAAKTSNFHFLFPKELRVQPSSYLEEYDDCDDDDDEY